MALAILKVQMGSMEITWVAAAQGHHRLSVVVGLRGARGLVVLVWGLMMADLQARAAAVLARAAAAVAGAMGSSLEVAATAAQARAAL